MLVLVFAATGRSAEELAPVPERLSAYIGGFMGASYGIELHAGALTYTSSDTGHRNTKQVRITPAAAEWRELRQALDDLKVWQWRANYPSQGTVDGTQWSLDIAYADHTVKCRGDNSYPDAKGSPTASPRRLPILIVTSLRSGS